MTNFDFDIEAVTKQVKKHHAASKKETAELENARIEFFAAATERLERQQRAQQSIMIPVSAKVVTNEDVISYVNRFYPEWKVIDIKDEPFRALVEEDPAWMKYTYVSKDRKTIYQRGITQASAGLDDDSLRADDPDLWLRITHCPTEDIVWEFARAAAKNDGGSVIASAQAYVEEHIDEWVRLLRPFDTLSEEDFEAIQSYIVPGKLSYRLEAPRKPKPEELE